MFGVDRYPQAGDASSDAPMTGSLRAGSGRRQRFRPSLRVHAAANLVSSRVRADLIRTRARSTRPLGRCTLGCGGSGRRRLGTARMLAVGQVRRTPIRTAAVAGVLGALISLVVVFGVVGDAQIRGLSGALEANDADLWVLASGAQGALSASRVEPELLGTVSAVGGIARVAPIGEIRVGVRIEGGALLDASLWGIDPDSPAAPPVIDGMPASDRHQAVVDAADRHLGAVPGARLELVDLPTTLRVVGLTEGRRFASIPTITVPYARWSEIVDALNPDSDDVVPTAFAVELEPAADPSEVAAAIAAAAPTLVAAAPSQLAAELPGIDGLRSSFGTAALVSLVAVAAISAAFTRLQVEQELRTMATLRAIGASPRILSRAHQVRVAMLVLLGALIAAVLIGMAQRLSPPQIPITLDVRTLATVTAATWAAAALAARRGLRGLRTLDPADVLRAPA
ncbi:MAG: ABC transporter permease [Nitriliruptor sp.]|nr:MAG: ABC transporter permease [Nitriliruptor sp.]